jgi:hypothetical protein
LDLKIKFGKVVLMEKLKAYARVQWSEMIVMKLIKAIAILIILSLTAGSVAGQMTGGQMTEYQRGVANGLKIGFFMGEYYGRGQYVLDYAGQFNTYLDSYNQFLWASFGNNQTLINEYMRSPIRGNLKSTSSGVLLPDASGRIFDYPAASYYTAIGAVPGTSPSNPYDAMPGV